MLSQQITVTNKYGLHARPSSLLAAKAGEFSCNVFVCKDEMKVDAKDVMNLLLLAAEKGTSLEIITDGIDEKDAMEAIITLISNEFDDYLSNE